MTRTLAAMLLTALPAGAQQLQCVDRAAFVAVLAKNYGETAQAAGINGAGNLIEVFASVETGTWTMLFTTPAGLTCIATSGSAWVAAPVSAGGALD